MHKVKADFSKNRLYITLGRLETGEAAVAAEAVIKECGRLKKGFTVVTDVSNFVPIDIYEQKQITKAQEHLVKSGMSKSVRVIGTSPIGQLQMNRLSRKVGYSSDRFETIKEAEASLDK